MTTEINNKLHIIDPDKVFEAYWNLFRNMCIYPASTDFKQLVAAPLVILEST